MEDFTIYLTPEEMENLTPEEKHLVESHNEMVADVTKLLRTRTTVFQNRLQLDVLSVAASLLFGTVVSVRLPIHYDIIGNRKDIINFRREEIYVPCPTR